MRSLGGLATVALLIVNLLLWGLPIMAFGLVKRLLPGGRLRQAVTRLLVHLAERWVDGNNRVFDLRLGVVWDIDVVEGLRYDARYLLVSNHVSAIDIVAVQRALQGHVAFIRFFIKQELIWAPIIGQACWAVDFPFMKRYSPEYLAKHPEKRGTDLETTRRACEKFRKIPVAILNYSEGTRFSREKQAAQESPYRHLLRPRVGGVAFVVASFGEQLDSILDITLAYPGSDHPTLWQFITNRVPRVTVRVRRLKIPPELRTATITEPGPERERFKGWMESIWAEKDALLEELLAPR